MERTVTKAFSGNLAQFKRFMKGAIVAEKKAKKQEKRKKGNK